MYLPATSLAWELWRRHRSGFAALLGVLCVYWLVVLATVPFEERFPELGRICAMPFLLLYFYTLVVFTYSAGTDLGSRQSGLPRRMFALPVGTAALVGIPMLFGTVTVTVLWALLVRFVLPSAGIAASLGAPALLLACCLAWLQAIAWSPFPVAIVRIVAAVAALVLPIGFSIACLHFQTPRGVLIAGLACQLPVAYGLAYVGVSCARRGEAPDWRWLSQCWESVLRRFLWRPDAFSSAATAHYWWEYRRSGLLLALAGVAALGLLPVLLFMPVSEMLPAWMLLSQFLGMPLMFAALLSGSFGSVDSSIPSFRIPSYLATRPLATTDLIAAKLKLAVVGTVATWGILLLFLPLWFLTADKREPLLALAQQWLPESAAGRVAWAASAIAGLMALTWRFWVKNMFIGLAGRVWIANTAGFSGLFEISAMIVGGRWIYVHPETHGALGRALPWILSVAIVLKLCAGAGVLRMVIRQKLMTSRTVLKWVAYWMAAVCGSFFLMCVVVPRGLVANWVLGMVAILLVPLTRLAAAPLALAWNRHR